jgi:hypothetical protein
LIGSGSFIAISLIPPKLDFKFEGAGEPFGRTFSNKTDSPPSSPMALSYLSMNFSGGCI